MTLRDSRGRFGHRAAYRFTQWDGTGARRRGWLRTACGRFMRELDPYSGTPIGPWRKVTR